MFIREIDNKHVVFAKDRGLYKFLRYHKNLEPLGFGSMDPNDNETYPFFQGWGEDGKKAREACKEYDEVVFRTAKKGLINFLVENKYKPFCTVNKKIVIDSDSSDDDIFLGSEVVDMTVWYVIVDDYARDLIKEWRSKFK